MSIDLTVFWRRKFILTLCLLIGASVGLAYVKFVPPTYEGQARVMIEPRNVVPESIPEGRVDPEFLPTQAETIRSPVTISRALETVAITPPSSADPKEFDPIRHVLKSLKVTPILKANVLTVSYKANSEEEVLELISGVVDAYKKHVSEHDQDDSLVSFQVIEAREKQLREELEEAQRDYNTQRANSPVFGEGREASTQAVSDASRISEEISQVRRRRIDLSTNLASILNSGFSEGEDKSQTLTSASSSQDASVQVAVAKPIEGKPSSRDIELVVRFAEPEDARALETLQEKSRYATINVDQLKQTYGPRHPSLLAAKAEMAELDALLQQRFQDIVQGWTRQLKVLESTEAKLVGTLSTEQEKLREANVALGLEESLKANVTRLEQMHAATAEQLHKMQTAEQAIAGGRTSIEVTMLEGPVLIPELTWPNPKLLIPAAACLGLLAGICMVLMAEMVWPPKRAEEPSRSRVGVGVDVAGLADDRVDLAFRNSARGARV